MSKAIVIATGVRTDGHREVLGVDIGGSGNETFWPSSSAASKTAAWTAFAS